MKTTFVANTGRVMTFCLILALTAISGTAIAKENAAIYNPDLDVTAALEQAQKSGKHILLMFGANWCPWCHKLHQLMKSDMNINRLLDKEYQVILVDVGEKRDQPLNRDLLKKYRAEGLGFPSLVVLNARGELLSVQNTGVLEKNGAHDPQKVLHFLQIQIASAPGK